MKIKVEAGLAVSKSAIGKVLQNTLQPFDLFLTYKRVGETADDYIILADLPEFEVAPSPEELVKAGLEKIAASREELTDAFHKAMQELRGQESDLLMLAHAPESASAEDITFNEPKTTEPFPDDFPF